MIQEIYPGKENGVHNVLEKKSTLNYQILTNKTNQK